MFAFFNVIFILLLGPQAFASKPTQIYNPVDPKVFAKYGPLWTSNHDSWVGIDPNEKYCDDFTALTSYPICTNTNGTNSLIQEPFLYSGDGAQSCRRAQCIPLVNGCGGFTPSDTIDYFPPVASTTLDNSTICNITISQIDQTVANYSLGLDTGIPPAYLPIIPVGLNISGTVYANFNDKCQVVENAQIIAWQVNPTLLQPLDTAAKRVSGNGNMYTTETSDSDSVEFLRDLSCRGQQHTSSDGRYSFLTYLSPSYGPPRHIMVTITAPGFQTLTTRVYFDIDWRLQQLTTQDNDIYARMKDDPAQAHGFATENGFEPSLFTGAVAKDPRVAKLQFKRTSSGTVQEGLTTGHFVVEHDFFLTAVRESDPRDTSAVPVLDINGFWSDPITGGFIQVETHGNAFIAKEYPHPRTWSMVMGYLSGMSIQGVNFARNNMPITPSSVDSVVKSSGLASGVIIPFDSFENTNPLGSARIEWSLDNMIWDRQDTRINNDYKYRYVKLLVLRSAGTNQGELRINEIEYYEGLLSDQPRPTLAQKMSSPRFPFPLAVACSSFLSQDQHCFKVFDGDSSSISTWVTQPVGVRRNVLATPQFVTLDFGDGHGIYPTAVKIVCDAANEDTNGQGGGCPMTFAIQVSHDNIKFDTVYRQDLFHYTPTTYANGGRVFYFYSDTPHGRVNGQRCGSCDTAPTFTCHADAYDSTCDSRYCDRTGRCNTLPICSMGKYLSTVYTNNYAGAVYNCELCSAGRYGNTTGLTSLTCSGLCQAGYYCPTGSVSSTQVVCGGPNVYCPEGSGQPLLAPSGYKTINTQLNNNSTTIVVNDCMTQDSIIECEAGNYCDYGIQTPCPVGTYGARGGLPSAACTASCTSGYYCAGGNVNPIVCPAGYYCEDGRDKTPCPSGRYGATTGLTDAFCSGECEPGYYCPIASVSAQQYPCPAGRYGDSPSLVDANCTGLCPEGYYCPTATISGATNKCGGVSVYCPIGSISPLPVSDGYYTASKDGVASVINNGSDALVQSQQIIAEKGFYALFGVRYACPAGTYGNASGLFPPMSSYVNTTKSPTPAPFMAPSQTPTQMPSLMPIALLTFVPSSSLSPSQSPLYSPTVSPSVFSSYTPTVAPSSASPTRDPSTSSPSLSFSPSYSRKPTAPTSQPSRQPTSQPSRHPSQQPSSQPTLQPTRRPTSQPSGQPSRQPTMQPSQQPASHPSSQPSRQPTGSPSHHPTRQPTSKPSQRPSRQPTSQPSRRPSSQPSQSPNANHTFAPVTKYPSSRPSLALLTTFTPTLMPTTNEEIFAIVNFACSGFCVAGYYCPENATSATRFPCPAGRYGMTTGLTDSSCTDICPLGFYCPEGTVQPNACPAGRYGGSTGLIDSTCSTVCGPVGTICDERYSRCQAGYYCPSGSISAKAYTCGGRNVYCPEGSGQPVSVDDGYYSFGGEDSALDGLVNLAQRLCEPGYFCVNGVRAPCPPGTYGDRYGLNSEQCSGLCPIGYYCPSASYNATQYSCPAGRYGSIVGSTSTACSGGCDQGYYCPSGSISATQVQCGTAVVNNNVLTRNAVFGEQNLVTSVQAQQAVYLSPGAINASALSSNPQNNSYYILQYPNSVFCPAFAARSIPALPGYYTTGNNATTRDAQSICSIGTYCEYGVKQACPGGTYGQIEGLKSSNCSGLCAKGYYCLPGSLTPTQHQCPIGRYGAVEGLSSAACSGPCLKPSDCPAGSTTSTRIVSV